MSADRRKQPSPAVKGEALFSGDCTVVESSVSGSHGAGVAELCEQFRKYWSLGRRPRIEQFLSDTVEPTRTALFVALLQIETEQRQQIGEELRPEEYSRRFPEYAQLLSSAVSSDITESLSATIGFEPGSSAARFELLQTVGIGGFGIVWKAYDRELDRLVALKRPRADRACMSDPNAFVSEARVAARLRHQNIVTVHQIEREEGSLIIVSEYVEGGSLRTRLKQQQFSPNEVAYLCAQVADALHHAHEQGVIHRDLKPDNILLDIKGRPLITDFGLAKRKLPDEITSFAGKVVGTVPYVSPEQAGGHSHGVDGRSDIFSLGIIIYEMLAGRRPFEGDQSTILTGILTLAPQPPSRFRNDIPRDLETICLKCLEKDPAARYATAGDLAADLRRFLHDEPVLARPQPPLERAWRFARRRATVIGVGLLAFACLPLLGFSLRPRGVMTGFEMVELTTQPPGAEVYFSPRHPQTGEPMPEQIIQAGVSPVRVPLLPADYLVVAVLDDDRFHEVYRHVPDEFERVPEGRNHLRWRRLPDGTLRLPEVTIPPASVTEGMAPVPGTAGFRVGIPGSTTAPVHSRRIPAFFMDPTEVSVADYRRLSDGRYPYDLRWTRPPDDQHAMTVRYDQAVELAEEMGKRLPTEAEFELAATERGRFNSLPAFENVEPGAESNQFGPVGTPADDRIAASPGHLIFGMYSNVAEWTSSRPPHSSEHRIVRGGDQKTLQGNGEISAERRDPRGRLPVNRHTLAPGLGFRCVRSAKPRINPEDFEAVIKRQPGLPKVRP